MFVKCTYPSLGICDPKPKTKSGSPKELNRLPFKTFEDVFILLERRKKIKHKTAPFLARVFIYVNERHFSCYRISQQKRFTCTGLKIKHKGIVQQKCIQCIEIKIK